MNNYTFFFKYFLDNWTTYLICLIISVLIYTPIIKNTCKSILDPLFLTLVLTLFANSVPIFLLFLGLISIESFLYVVICECLFWISYFVFAKKNIQFSKIKMHDSIAGDYCYLFFLCIMVVSHMITYLKFGIPLFMTSRLETYSGGGGWGILYYIQNFSIFYCAVYSMYLLKRKKLKFYSLLGLFLITIFSFLSGAKSAIMILVYAYFFFSFFYLEKNIHLKRFIYYLIPFVLIFPIFLISKQNDISPLAAFISLLRRFVASGDVYWIALPDNVMDNVDINNKFTYLFSRILAMFRIIDPAQVETPIGVQLNWLVNPNEYGIIKGPNSRLPILCWILFKWNGIILAPIFGFICAFWRTWIPMYLPHGIIPIIFYGFIYVGLCGIFTDPLMGTSNFFSIFLFSTILYAAYILFGGRYIKLSPR